MNSKYLCEGTSDNSKEDHVQNEIASFLKHDFNWKNAVYNTWLGSTINFGNPSCRKPGKIYYLKMLSVFLPPGEVLDIKCEAMSPFDLGQLFPQKDLFKQVKSKYLSRNGHVWIKMIFKQLNWCSHWKRLKWMETARYFWKLFPLEEYFVPGYVFRLHCWGSRLVTVCLWCRIVLPMLLVQSDQA